jgi:hypothetical protein
MKFNMKDNLMPNIIRDRESIDKKNSLIIKKFFSQFPSILIVDDTIFNIIALKTLLTSFDIDNIDEAYNG